MRDAWKPTEDDIKKLFEKCKTDYYGNLFSAFDEDDRYYELAFKSSLKIPAEFETSGVVLPTARTLVDTYVNHVDIAHPIVGIASIKGRNEDDANYHDRLKMMKQYGQAFLYANNVLSTIAPLAVSRRHYALHGLTWLKTVYDRELWPDAPARDKYGDDAEYAEALDYWRAHTHESVPVVLQAIHPGCVMPDPTHRALFSPRYLFEWHEQMRVDIDEAYPGWKNPLGKGPTDSVERISFFTPFYRGEFCDWVPMLDEDLMPHSYGFIPYTGIESGLGNIDVKMDPVKRYVGILRYLHDLLIAESRAYSIDDVVLAKQAWPTVDIEGVTAENASLLQYSQKFGTLNKIPDGMKIVEHGHPVTPEALRQHYSITGNAIREHAAPSVLLGVAEQGVRSDVDRRGMGATAAQRFAYSEQAYSNGMANVLNKAARIMKSPDIVPGDEKIWMQTPADEFGVEIDREQMKEPFSYTVKFNPIDPEWDIRLHDDIMRLLESGVYNLPEARRRMPGIDADMMDREDKKNAMRANIAPVIASYHQQKAQAIVGEVAAAEGLPPAMPQQGEQGQETAPAEGPGRSVLAPSSPKPSAGSYQGLVAQNERLRSSTPIGNQGAGGGGNRKGKKTNE